MARLLARVPPWVRVYRIQRDIPMPLVTSGVEKGNLRELALARMGQLGLRCRDVRTREVGIQARPSALAQACPVTCVLSCAPCTRQCLQRLSSRVVFICQTDIQACVSARIFNLINACPEPGHHCSVLSTLHVQALACALLLGMR